jgi:hypothetical protein
MGARELKNLEATHKGVRLMLNLLYYFTRPTLYAPILSWHAGMYA